MTIIFFTIVNKSEILHYDFFTGVFKISRVVVNESKKPKASKSNIPG